MQNGVQPGEGCFMPRAPFYRPQIDLRRRGRSHWIEGRIAENEQADQRREGPSAEK